MLTLAEKLGLLAKAFQELGIDPRYPTSLLMPRIYFLAPKIVSKLADAS
ncbi:MAG: hypothetical protein ABWK05_02865 [Pyrobaculum sp.]